MMLLACVCRCSETMTFESCDLWFCLITIHHHNVTGRCLKFEYRYILNFSCFSLISVFFPLPSPLCSDDLPLLSQIRVSSRVPSPSPNECLVVTGYAFIKFSMSIPQLDILILDFWETNIEPGLFSDHPNPDFRMVLGQLVYAECITCS